MAAIVLISATMALGAHERAFACSCVDHTFEAYMAAASLVFTGVARRPAVADATARVAFDVEAVYKGVTRARTTVDTPSGSAACGIPFEAGKRYVVVAAEQVGRPPATTLCSGTTDDASVVAGLTAVQTFAAPRTKDGEPASRSVPVGLAAGVFALVVAASVWGWMIRSRPRPLV